MDSDTHERELRAARNQSLFRSINRRLEALNEAFESVTQTFTIACECADQGCVTMVEIEPAAYEAVRAEPRRFVVCRGHIFPEVEKVVGEEQGYVIVEKTGAAGEFAETLEERS
jgi:hypothetical protein